jgi:hypothetical protein
MTIGISAAARARAAIRAWKVGPASPGAATLASTRRTYYRCACATSLGGPRKEAVSRNDVKWAVLETDASISFIPKSDS